MAQAKPIIFIHGLFYTPYDMPRVAQFLAPNRVMIPDLPGYGVHQEAGEVSVGAAADFIYKQIRALGREQAHLVGHSVGGAVAVVVASRYAQAVASLVSVEGNFTLRDAFWSQRFARMDRSEASAVLEGYRADPKGWLAGSGIDATEEQVELAGRMLAAQPVSTLQAMAASVVETTGDVAYLQSIATLLDRQIPFHMLAGERSRAGWDVPAWVLERTGGVTIQPGAGHLMMLEDQQRYLSIIRQLIPR